MKQEIESGHMVGDGIAEEERRAEVENLKVSILASQLAPENARRRRHLIIQQNRDFQIWHEVIQKGSGDTSIGILTKKESNLLGVYLGSSENFSRFHVYVECHRSN